MKASTLLIPVLFLITFSTAMGGMPLVLGTAAEIYDSYILGQNRQSNIVELVLAVAAGNDYDYISEKERQEFLNSVSLGAGRITGNSSIPYNINSNATGDKAVILAFDDGWESQYQYAKPILDEFGFKATFFIVCDFVSTGPYMSWEEMENLRQEGHDIQSHTMSHKNLAELSAEEIEYEVGQSKECLLDRGINATVLATPFNVGWDDARVIDSIARHYELAKNGNDNVMYLHCDGWKGGLLANQTDCRTYLENEDGTKKLNFVNRYAIKAWSHNYQDHLYGPDLTKIFEEFVEAVNRPAALNKNGELDAITVLEYHRVNDGLVPDAHAEDGNTDPSLFYAEMKYLYDNGFTVLVMSDLGYDEDNNHLYVKS